VSDTDTEALARAIEDTPAERRKRGVSVEWADRIEGLLIEVDRKLDRLLGVEGERPKIVERDGRVFSPGAGWLGESPSAPQLDLDLDDDPPPMTAYEAMTAARRALDRSHQPKER
jgi:hypothetical protein